MSTPSADSVPANLLHATLRLNFPPSYVVVGVYRLCTDESLYKPAWELCRNGVRRGLTVGLVWTLLTFKFQKHVIRTLVRHPSSLLSLGFLSRLSESAEELSEESFVGLRLPFNLSTYMAILLLGSQVTSILTFFLSQNIRTTRQHVWDQTVASRGKGPDFWKPYVEEWDTPPVVDKSLKERFTGAMKKWAVIMVIKKVFLLHLSLYPFVGALASAGFKCINTAQQLHKPYFKAKKMSPHEVSVFIEERKWDYRLFGFAAALLEGIPIVGLAFTVSNRIGAAMWAFDLEKRQHYVAEQRASGSSGDKSKTS